MATLGMPQAEAGVQSLMPAVIQLGVQVVDSVVIVNPVQHVQAITVALQEIGTASTDTQGQAGILTDALLSRQGVVVLAINRGVFRAIAVSCVEFFLVTRIDVEGFPFVTLDAVAQVDEVVAVVTLDLSADHPAGKAAEAGGHVAVVDFYLFQQVHVQIVALG